MVVVYHNVQLARCLAAAAWRNRHNHIRKKGEKCVESDIMKLHHVSRSGIESVSEQICPRVLQGCFWSMKMIVRIYWYFFRISSSVSWSDHRLRSLTASLLSLLFTTRTSGWFPITWLAVCIVPEDLGTARLYHAVGSNSIQFQFYLKMLE